MLKSIKARTRRKTSGEFAIVASQYNGRYVDAMLRAARAELLRAGQTRVHVIRVPGAFEIPVVAARLAASAHALRSTPHPLCAIICFGVIFQGETSHAQHIGWGVTHALAQIQIQHHIPVIHAVFVFEKEEHAQVRCLGKTHNRGTEAARTALSMAGVMKDMESEEAMY
jgi:6,7-dimethyl-8-ribityllumazine synthase